MHIKFNNLKLYNFMSFSDSEVCLSTSGYTLVSGINNNKDDAAKSNGSGKSSIWEAIVWALTGQTIRGTKDIVNNSSTVGAYVELTFNIDSDSFKITRYKDHSEFGSNLKIIKNNFDISGKGIRDSEKILEQHLPDLTAQLLGSVIILGQGLPQRFTNNTPSGRKEVLEKLSKSDYMIEDIKDKLSTRKINLNSDLRKVEDTILVLSSKKDTLEERLVKLKEDKALLVPVDFDGDILRNQKQLDFLIDNQIDCYNLVLKLEVEVNNKLKEYQDWTSKVNANYLSECNIIDEKYNINDLASNLNRLESEINSKNKEINLLESVKDTCPTCGQKLPNINKVDTSKQREELENLKNKYSIDSKYFAEISEEIKIAKQNVYDKLNKDTEIIKDEGKKLREELNAANDENNSYLKEINTIKLTIDKIKLNKENYEKQFKTIDTDISDCQNNINEISGKILYNNIEKDNIMNRLNIVNKMLTIATRDFRGFLLSEVINFINNKAKDYAVKLFDTNKIDFLLEGNNINIYFNSKQYENLSGGEKQKIDLIVQFSIRDMLSKFLNFSSNILVLDEIFDNLDDIGCQKVLDLISNTLIDIDSIYIITHHSDINIPFDNELVVVKDIKGISKVQ